MKESLSEYEKYVRVQNLLYSIFLLSDKSKLYQGQDRKHSDFTFIVLISEIIINSTILPTNF
jgi:hypothetical protein